ncbi:MAG: DUF1989 domain-containing protein, partial [Pseudomonadota bacterium]
YVLVTNRRRPLNEIDEDTSPGVHDILIACCDQPRYTASGQASSALNMGMADRTPRMRAM